jgi:hypothetical protein
MDTLSETRKENSIFCCPRNASEAVRICASSSTGTRSISFGSICATPPAIDPTFTNEGVALNALQVIEDDHRVKRRITIKSAGKIRFRIQEKVDVVRRCFRLVPDHSERLLAVPASTHVRKQERSRRAFLLLASGGHVAIRSIGRMPGWAWSTAGVISDRSSVRSSPISTFFVTSMRLFRYVFGANFTNQSL